jgi:hypothetical protein
VEILYVYELSPYLDLMHDGRVFRVCLLCTIPGDAIRSVLNLLYISECWSLPQGMSSFVILICIILAEQEDKVAHLFVLTFRRLMSTIVDVPHL